MRLAWCGVLLVPLVGLAGAFAQPAPSSEAVVTDVEGKEFKLTGLKFGTGTHRMGWLADPTGTTEDVRKGPQAIELREQHSTTFTKGVVTFVPVANLESVKYDYEKQVVAVTVKGIKEPLTGTLQYKGINVLGLGGMVDGKAAAFTGGVVGKTSVKTATFPGAQPVPKPKAGGTTWAVQIVQPKAENPILKVRNLKTLYRYPGGTEHLVDGIPIRKGPGPIPFNATLQRFELLANDTNTNIAAAEIEVTGSPERIIAIPLTLEQDKKIGTLVGFLGEVDAGYKLFPLHTIKTIERYEKKVE